MSDHDDGGPAFPNITPDMIEWCRPGMTLLDYFAGLAMQSMVAGEGARQVAERDDRYDETNWDYIVASNAYVMAEAMLREKRRREKGEGDG